MVCPMRFVLVGVSAIVALGVAFWAWQEHEETVKESGDEDARRQSRNGRGNNKASNPGSWLSLIFDMFTGRYLWNLMGPRHGHAADTKVEDSSPQRRKVQ